MIISKGNPLYNYIWNNISIMSSSFTKSIEQWFQQNNIEVRVYHANERDEVGHYRLVRYIEIADEDYIILKMKYL